MCVARQATQKASPCRYLLQGPSSLFALNDAFEIRREGLCLERFGGKRFASANRIIGAVRSRSQLR